MKKKQYFLMCIDPQKIRTKHKKIYTYNVLKTHQTFVQENGMIFDGWWSSSSNRESIRNDIKSMQEEIKLKVYNDEVREMHPTYRHI